MKAHRAETKPAFIPVVITLESQEEVDQMTALLINNDIAPLGTPLGAAYRDLVGFQNEANRKAKYDPIIDQATSRRAK